MKVLGAVPLEAKNLARRSERHHQLDRLVETRADGDRLVAAVKRDIGVPGAVEDVRGGVSVRHRERARAAGWFVVLVGAADDLLDDLLRPVDPFVVRAPAPDDHDQPTARRQRFPHVAQRNDRAREEHRPEAGERHLVRSPRYVLLDVGDLEARVADPGVGGVLAGGVDEPGRGVDADRLAVWSDELGDPLGRVAESAADVEHRLTAARRVQRERPLAVRAEPHRHDVAELDEPVIEGSVPGDDRLSVRARRMRERCHLECLSGGEGVKDVERVLGDAGNGAETGVGGELADLALR
jgi:hypothetical protein